MKLEEKRKAEDGGPYQSMIEVGRCCGEPFVPGLGDHWKKCRCGCGQHRGCARHA